jgi:4-amino-4-deoxy-L-arabinose transferase-like glycosyltransferase
VVPYFEDRPRLVKPPLVHWIQSTLFAGLGQSEWVARLHSILATLGTISLVAWVARRRFGAEGATWAAACLATTPLAVAVGRIGTLDALLALHVFAVVALDMVEPRQSGRYRSLAVGALLGLAFLIKGPVGVVLPLLIVLAGRTAARRELLPGWPALLNGVAGWCLVVLPWSLALIRRVGFGAVAEVTRGEALERYFAGTTHVQPFWYYAVVLLVGFFPWVAPLLLAMVRLPAQYGRPSARTALYAGAGLAAGLVFFSLSQSKLPNYILPLVPLTAIVVCWQLGEELRSARRSMTGSALLGGTLAAFAVVFAIAAATRLDDTPQRVAGIGAVLHAAGALATLPGLWKRRPRWVYGAAAITSAAFLFTIVSVLLPDISRTRTSAYLVREVPALAASDRPLIMVEMKVPSLTYYLDRVPEEVAAGRLGRRLDADDDPVIVFDEDDLTDVTKATMQRLQPIGRQGKYVVYEKRSR